MKKTYLLRFGLFLGLYLTFGGGIVFGENSGNIDCRTAQPGDINGPHIYTCEYDDPHNKERLANYCAKDGTASSRKEYECKTKGVNLKCHICYCPETKERKNGICQTIKNEAEEADGSEEAEEETPVAIDGNTTDGDTTTEETECKTNILNSQGNCCKKVYYDVEKGKELCCEGILLNTNVPFIGQCIVFRKNNHQMPVAGLVVDEETAFPILMGGLSKIMVSIILLASFVGILIGGVMISASGSTESGANKGKKIIGNVISALAILGASGVILRLINPNFFG